MSESIAFIVITEKGKLERESMLLADSLRTFGGSLCDAPIYSFEPRCASSRISEDTKSRFRALGVDHRTIPVNVRYPENPFANKPFVCAYCEKNLDADVLVFLDSDIVFLGEPNRFLDCQYYDIAVRPVHAKNIGTSGPEDEFSGFWSRLYVLCGVKRQVVVRPVYGGPNILGYWNAGVIAERRASGIFSRWCKDYENALENDILPPRDEQYLEQAVLSATVCAMTEKILNLPRSYNYPFQGHNLCAHSEKICRLSEMVCIHYHQAFNWWFEHLYTMQSLKKSGRRLRWLIEKLQQYGFTPTKNPEALFMNDLAPETLIEHLKAVSL